MHTWKFIGRKSVAGAERSVREAQISVIYRWLNFSSWMAVTVERSVLICIWRCNYKFPHYYDNDLFEMMLYMSPLLRWDSQNWTGAAVPSWWDCLFSASHCVFFSLFTTVFGKWCHIVIFTSCIIAVCLCLQRGTLWPSLKKMLNVSYSRSPNWFPPSPGWTERFWWREHCTFQYVHYLKV